MSGDFSRPVLIHQVWVVWRAVFGRSVLNLPAEAKLPHPSSLTPEPQLVLENHSKCPTLYLNLFTSVFKSYPQNFKTHCAPRRLVFDSKVRRDSARSSFKFLSVCACLWDCGALVKLLIPGSTATRKAVAGDWRLCLEIRLHESRSWVIEVAQASSLSWTHSLTDPNSNLYTKSV